MGGYVYLFEESASCEKARKDFGENALAKIARILRLPFKDRGPMPYALRKGETLETHPYLCPICGMRDVSEAAHNYVDPKHSTRSAGNCQFEQPLVGEKGKAKHGAKNRDGERRVDTEREI